MNKLEELKENLKAEYQKCFEKLGISEESPRDKKTGFKFHTYPYIGSKYTESKKKILFIGLSVGDEKENNDEHIFSFEKRNGDIETYKPNVADREKSNLGGHNPHIAGTYFLALYYLREVMGWESYWDDLKTLGTCQDILKNYQEKLPEKNPLAYVALTNYVKTTADDKSGMKHKERWINEKAEEELLINEIKIFNPEVVLFQSADFKKKSNLLKEISKEYYVGYHPSSGCYGKPEFLIPENLVNTYVERY